MALYNVKPPYTPPQDLAIPDVRFSKVPDWMTAPAPWYDTQKEGPHPPFPPLPSSRPSVSGSQGGEGDGAEAQGGETLPEVAPGGEKGSSRGGRSAQDEPGAEGTAPGVRRKGHVEQGGGGVLRGKEELGDDEEDREECPERGRESHQEAGGAAEVTGEDREWKEWLARKRSSRQDSSD